MSCMTDADWKQAHLMSAKPSESQRRSETARLKSLVAKVQGKSKPSPERRRGHTAFMQLALSGYSKPRPQ